MAELEDQDRKMVKYCAEVLLRAQKSPKIQKKLRRALEYNLEMFDFAIQGSLMI
jgi:hypothetical protein